MQMKVVPVNLVIIQGNVGKDPYVGKTKSGDNFIAFSVAINRNYQKDNKWHTHTTWIPVSMFGAAAERASKSITSGTAVTIEGRLAERKILKDAQKSASPEISQLYLVPRSLKVFFEKDVKTEDKAPDVVIETSDDSINVNDDFLSEVPPDVLNSEANQG